MEIVKVILAIVVAYNWHLHQLDAENANLHEKSYMDLSYSLIPEHLN